MTSGTLFRTIARVIVSLNTAIYAVSAAVAGLNFDTLTLIWTILTIAADFAVAFVTTYYNNDYSEEARMFTAGMRAAKKAPDYDEEDEEAEELPANYFEGGE